MQPRNANQHNNEAVQCTRTAVFLLKIQTVSIESKRVRRRSAAIPPDELSWENVGKMWQHVATCARVEQHMTTCKGLVALP